MFRTSEVAVITGFPGLLWEKWKNWRFHVIRIKKIEKKNFFRLAWSALDVKWCKEPKKVGPNALRRLLFEKMGVFFKKWVSRICGQIRKIMNTKVSFIVKMHAWKTKKYTLILMSNEYPSIWDQLRHASSNRSEITFLQR